MLRRVPAASPQQLRRNITIEMVFGFVMYLNLLQPLLQKYYLHNGLTQFDISCLLSLYMAMVLALDIPTGYIGDRCGYRLVRQVGAVWLSLGFLTLYFSHSLPAITLGVVLWGIGASCMRGASDAHAKLSAERLGGKRNWYAWFTNYSLSFMAAGEAVGAVAAWAVLLYMGADGDPRIVTLWQCAVFLSPIVLLQFLDEQHPDCASLPQSAMARLKLMAHLLMRGWKDMGRQARTALSKPRLRDSLAFAGVLNATTNSVTGIALAYFEVAGLSTLQVPLVWAAYQVCWAVTPFIVVPYERHLGRGYALASVPVISFALYCAVAAASYTLGLWLIAGFLFVRSVHLSIMRNYVLSMTPQDQRGLVASMVTTSQMAISALMNLLIGVIIHYWSVRTACMVAGLIYLPAGLLLAARMRRYRRLPVMA